MTSERRSLAPYAFPVRVDAALAADLKNLEERLMMRAWIRLRLEAVERGGYD